MSIELQTTRKIGILEMIGNKYSIDPAKVLTVLSSTVFKQGSGEAPLSAEEFQAALIVANQYDLNPFTKEIFAFRSKGKLLTVVSIDGWSAIINRRPEFDGIEFSESFDDGDKIVSVTCKMHRKDRGLPTVITEYMSECARDTEPWRKSPVRMLRHKAMIQCARMAFGFSGIVDPDEAERTVGPSVPLLEATVTGPSGPTRSAKIAHRLSQPKALALAVEEDPLAAFEAETSQNQINMDAEDTE